MGAASADVVSAEAAMAGAASTGAASGVPSGVAWATVVLYL